MSRIGPSPSDVSGGVSAEGGAMPVLCEGCGAVCRKGTRQCGTVSCEHYGGDRRGMQSYSMRKIR